MDNPEFTLDFPIFTSIYRNLPAIHPAKTAATCVYNSCVLGGRTTEQWVAQYSRSHQHPVNRFCHSFGIPMIVSALVAAVAGIFFRQLWIYAAILFLAGWALQFVGHAFEGKKPEFLNDWRFLLVGVRWWWSKMQRKA
jgi:uncharacterized membrane protein YGL010W